MVTDPLQVLASRFSNLDRADNLLFYPDALTNQLSFWGVNPWIADMDRMRAVYKGVKTDWFKDLWGDRDKKQLAPKKLHCRHGCLYGEKGNRVYE